MSVTIIMAVHDTVENNRSRYTKQTIECLLETVDFSKHRLFISDNGSCNRTQDIYEDLLFTWGYEGNPTSHLTIQKNGENLGTAKAVNLGIKTRQPNEHIIKIDNDCVIHCSGWVEQMISVIEKDSSIGIVGLKRKDLAEWPLEEGWAKSELIPLPHIAGEQWLVVERVNHVMGTCQMLSSDLLDKVGGYFQGDGIIYGFDDSLISLRSSLLGFKNVFLPHVDISHIDTGSGEYVDWKHRYAGEKMEQYNKICNEYRSGIRDLYFDFNSVL